MAVDSIVLAKLQDQARGWAWVARQFAAMSYRVRVQAWLEHSALDHVDTAGTRVVARSLGCLTAVSASGKTVEMQAPVPLA